MVNLFDVDGDVLTVEEAQVEKYLAKGYSKTNPKAKTSAGVNPAKTAASKFKQDVFIDLSDASFRTTAAEISAHALEHAVGGVPGVIAAGFPKDSIPAENGVTLAEFEATASKALPKRKRNKPDEIYFALRVEGEYNGQKWNANLLMPRNIPNEGDVIKVALLTRHESASGLTLNVI